MNDTANDALLANSPPATGHGPRRWRPLSNQTCRGFKATVVMLSLAPLFVAQTGEPPAAGATPVAAGQQALAGIHYQALVGAEAVSVTAPQFADELAMFLPRPPLAAWSTAAVTSDSGCLELGSLSDPGPGFVLVQEARAVGHDGGVLGPGQSCSARVRAVFSDEERSWEAVVAVHVHRPAAVPFPADDLTTQLTVSRIEAARADPMAPAQRVLLVEVALTNNGTQDLELVGIADPAGFAAATGVVYRLPPGVYIGTVRELLALDGATTNVPIAAGESVRLGLLLDPEAGLALTSGTLTVQPAVIVRRGDDTFSLRLNRVSTTWGEELP